MMKKLTAAGLAAGTVLAGAIGVAWADADGKGQRHQVRVAHFVPLPGVEGHDDVKGKAKLVLDKAGDGGTTVRVDLRGLVPSATYGAHLHVGNCSDAVGPHYVEPGLNLPWSELWPTVEVDGAGRGIGEASRDWVADDSEGLTVVVHDPQTNDKVLCAEF